MKCRRCNRTLKSPAAILAGVGPTCAKRRQRDAQASTPAPTVYFMSSPNTNDRQRRSYTVKFHGERYALVRVFPDATGDGRTATCDCPTGENQRRLCRHIQAVAPVDRRKFPQVENLKTEQNEYAKGIY